ncbi:hypothetical protein HWV01_08275 [Moritella sp. 5]|nr:hypothetical protein HWV01_08275 [Moritella sp. 5]
MGFITEVVMRIFLILIVCGLLSACMSNSIQRQPHVKVEAVTHKIAIQLDSEKLNESDKAALIEFIYQRGELSALRVRIDSYSDKGNKAVPELIAILKQAGIYPSQVSSQFSESSSIADVAIVVESYRSIVPSCQAGKAKHIVLNAFRSSDNFGCANTSALAQMVATPRDLIVGRTLEATDGRKAVATVEAYYQPVASNNQDKDKKSSVAASLGGQ